MSAEPFVYFDFVLCHGTLNGAIQVELGARTLDPGETVPSVGHKATARLRCSPMAAADLINALQGALSMFEADRDKPPQSVN